MRLKDIARLNEASGYIPKNDQEAKDPRWQMAITKDIQPGETQRQAEKMGWTTDAEGKPPQLKTNGRVSESMMDVAIQSRQPVSAGARGLLHARSDFNSFVKRSNDTVNRSAADALAWAVQTPGQIDNVVIHIAVKFKIEPEQLLGIFRKHFGMSIYEFAKKCQHTYNTAPKKI
jgi:hypothetical protein